MSPLHESSIQSDCLYSIYTYRHLLLPLSTFCTVRGAPIANSPVDTGKLAGPSWPRHPRISQFSTVLSSRIVWARNPRRLTRLCGEGNRTHTVCPLGDFERSRSVSIPAGRGILHPPCYGSTNARSYSNCRWKSTRDRHFCWYLPSLSTFLGGIQYNWSETLSLSRYANVCDNKFERGFPYKYSKFFGKHVTPDNLYSLTVKLIKRLSHSVYQVPGKTTFGALRVVMAIKLKAYYCINAKSLVQHATGLTKQQINKLRKADCRICLTKQIKYSQRIYYFHDHSTCLLIFFCNGQGEQHNTIIRRGCSAF